MAERLAAELLDASNGLGAAIKRKEDLQKMAESNRGVRALPLVALGLVAGADAAAIRRHSAQALARRRARRLASLAPTLGGRRPPAAASLGT